MGADGVHGQDQLADRRGLGELISLDLLRFEQESVVRPEFDPFPCRQSELPDYVMGETAVRRVAATRFPFDVIREKAPGFTLLG